MPIVLDNIESFIRSHLASLWSINLKPEDVRIEAFAEKLSVHKRTLQRKLGECGLYYANILDDARKGKSIDLLINTDLCVRDISAMIGFTDRTGYHHAHKRWFDMSPQNFRIAYIGNSLDKLTPKATTSIDFALN